MDDERFIINARIVWKDPKAVRAVLVISRAFDELADDMPWRPELKRAAKAAKYLIKHMEVVRG